VPVAIQRGRRWFGGIEREVFHRNSCARFVLKLHASDRSVLLCGEAGIELACDLGSFRFARNYRGMQMSRFFFHSVTVDGEMKDDVGVEVDDGALYREAIEAVVEVQAEFGVREDDADVLGFRVVNEVGQTVLELPLQAIANSLH
jgi:hypothetical protein